MKVAAGGIDPSGRGGGGQVVLYGHVGAVTVDDGDIGRVREGAEIIFLEMVGY